MYPITFLTSYLLLAFCHFGAAEPPPSHGYGPPSPVEFGSNEIGSHEQYSAPADFGSYNSYSSGSPSSFSGGPSSAYKSGPPSFSPHYSSSGPKYSGGLGGKGGVSSSYISIVHGAGSANGPGKSRPASYAAPGKGPTQVINSYNPPSFGNAAAFTDVKSFGGASPYSGGASPYSSGSSQYSSGGSPYSSGEVFGSNSYNKFGGAAAPYGAGSYESFSPGSSADYNKGYESGGVSDEVASYSSGGPSYATFTGSSKLSYTPSFSQGSRGNAFSTSNVNVFGGKNSGHGNFHPPSYTSNLKPSSGGAKVYSRYSGPSSFGPSSSSYSSPSLGSGESGYNSRALKAGYGIENSEDFASSNEDPNAFSGAFGDGAGFKVQSSYSTG